MPEFLENPRRVPREPVRCRAQVRSAKGMLEATTEDIGSCGCQLVLPSAPHAGDLVTLTLSAAPYPPRLQVDARVAWVSPQAPWRVGFAYVPEAQAAAASWIDGLRQHAPQLFAPGRRSCERVAVDAMVFLGSVPRLADFGRDELAVLRAIGAGVRVGDLRNSVALSWPRIRRAFFALYSQGYLTLARAEGAHPIAWRAILDEPIRVRPATVYRPGLTPPAPTLTPTPTPTPAAARPPGRPTPAPAPTPSASTPTPVPSLSRRNGSPPDPASAGAGWRAASRPRPPEAEAMYQLALVELETQHPFQALALLRRALSLAPGDADVATAIGRALQSQRTISP